MLTHISLGIRADRARSMGLFAASAVCAMAGAALGGPNTVADNGNGTADLPPFGLTYYSVPSAATPSGQMNVVNGLPVGSTLKADAALGGFFWNPMGGVYSFMGTQSVAGGVLGGEKHAADGVLTLDLDGTGVFAGYFRTLNVPISLEMHSAPRTNFAPVQSFSTDLFRFFGQVTGDPDFDLFRVVMGSDFGLPGPGQTTLTSAPGSMWHVDSFFDVFYRIDFVGAPGGVFSGMSGSTTLQVRLAIPAPAAGTMLAMAGVVGLGRRRRREC
ncbi:MAG: hypothetical protein KF768_00355 [Phycisphaeraceae bacterium]|nr:hypothetical protein [Phycisphaeraceae bacterium]